MITYHPSAAKAPNGRGFRPIVMLRKDSGQMVGSKLGTTVYSIKGDARNAAREACHSAVAYLERNYPQFIVCIA